MIGSNVCAYSLDVPFFASEELFAEICRNRGMKGSFRKDKVYLDEFGDGCGRRAVQLAKELLQYAKDTERQIVNGAIAGEAREAEIDGSKTWLVRCDVEFGSSKLIQFLAEARSSEPAKIMDVWLEEMAIHLGYNSWKSYLLDEDSDACIVPNPSKELIQKYGGKND